MSYRHCFGFFMHGIAETHVSHHLVSKMYVSARPCHAKSKLMCLSPHYNAWDATEALKKVLGPHYLFNDTNVFRGLWESACGSRSRGEQR
jgi:omega-6 fatty acid desaturase (delta-12 desaturase)